VRLLGVRRAAQHFPRALPHVFRHFAAPVNRLRARHGLAPLGSLPEVLCAGDVTLYADPAALAPLPAAPAHHRHLGAVSWAPAIPLPAWWQTLDPGRPTVYLTLGSSGRSELVPLVLRALAQAGLQILVATAARIPPRDLPALPHVYVAPYLPGDAACARADVVISNGGSTTSYQALAAGKPVVGIASNLDQYLAMELITRAGAGLLVRAGNAQAAEIRAAVAHALSSPALRAAAQRLAPAFYSDPAAPFVRALEDAIATR
jgi:UDP:flavonoid glycosyltransferase YjiC (YdhE family)